MRVLFVGETTGQPLGMQRAMERIGHKITVVDPYLPVRRHALLSRWAFHTGGLLLEQRVAQHVQSEVDPLAQFDVVFVDNGELISASLVRYLRTRASRVVLFNRDNPFVPRDGLRWRALKHALPYYDLFATPRESTATKAPAYGARKVLQVNFFADELLHRPREPTPQERERFSSPVSFVGTWFPERGPFMQVLIDRGVPLRIIGQKWDRSENWRQLAPHVVSGYLSPIDYTGALLSCEIAIAMLSKGNEDVTTSRSMEIPGLGKLLCAERTAEHQQLYREGEEAVFWSSAEECADVCLELLADPVRIAKIADSGRHAAERNGNWSELVLERILQTTIA